MQLSFCSFLHHSQFHAHSTRASLPHAPSIQLGVLRHWPLARDRARVKGSDLPLPTKNNAPLTHSPKQRLCSSIFFPTFFFFFFFLPETQCPQALCSIFPSHFPCGRLRGRPASHCLALLIFSQYALPLQPSEISSSKMVFAKVINKRAQDLYDLTISW